MKQYLYRLKEISLDGPLVPRQIGDVVKLSGVIYKIIEINGPCPLPGGRGLIECTLEVVS